MKDKYVFKGQDITTDMLFKIEQIASILAEKEHILFDDAYEMFVSSDTYSTLKRTDNLYWAESAEFIADEYYREKSLSVVPYSFQNT
jgi:hypothetical protein